MPLATARPSEASLLHNVCDEFTYDDFGPDSLLVHDRRGFDAGTLTLTLALTRTLILNLALALALAPILTSYRARRARRGHGAAGDACSCRDGVQGHAAAVDEYVPLQARTL